MVNVVTFKKLLHLKVIECQFSIPNDPISWDFYQYQNMLHVI